MPLTTTPRITEGRECPKCHSTSTAMVEELADSDRWLCHVCGKKWRQPTRDAHHLVGVGGWLALFILGMTIFSPILTALNLVKEFEGLGLVAIFDAVISVPLMFFGIYAGVRLWKIRPNAVRTAKRYLVAYFVYSAAILLLVILGSISAQTNEKTSSQEIVTVARSFIYAIIWYSYLAKSKRVAATYATSTPQLAEAGEQVYTTTPPLIAQPQLSTDQPVRVSPIIRDVVIVWLLTAMGGFVVGVVAGGPPRDAQRYMLGLAVSNLLLGTVAFTIAGCLAPPRRWRHLGFVAFGAWFTSLINVVFFGVSIPQWIGGAIFMAIFMGLGGAISYLFKRDTKTDGVS